MPYVDKVKSVKKTRGFPNRGERYGAKYENGVAYSLFGDSENRENNYLKIRDLLSIALFNILGTHYVIHI